MALMKRRGPLAGAQNRTKNVDLRKSCLVFSTGLFLFE